MNWFSARTRPSKKVTLPPDFIVDLHGAVVRGVDLSRTNLARANLSGVDARHTDFTDADFKDAILDGIKLQGAILTGARNLTLEQLRAAEVDETTVLPDGISLESLQRECAA